ncbi:hypothetical protein EV663_11331 [Rhodovulum bhavnagarense]|uniref:DUF2062 domain-containing protein n=1 Tax=Rhodovulum bhavnagarense TaxID=992286 RepID=A0A4R2RLE3_9RHOB|nr:DUF2062 domain-containing protein [Rhodovulum bhavnagarense]TCP60035.1 hypothetical protein EV663_11331 [Rhodovulum bhavnagarense]
MVFKRRDKRSIGQIVLDSLYPRGGWGRAIHYITHRVRRLPDSPHRIARGIFAGVFVCFTPFFGLHFILAALLARLLQGNLVAALLATLVGNPLTYVPIGVVSLKTGHFLMGTEFDETMETTLLGKFAGAGADLWDNLLAVFTKADADWAKLSQFYHEVFLPYLVGGIGPGLIAGIAAYHLGMPLIAVYQHRRKGRLKQKLAGLRKPAAKAEDRR